jgi:hypothetical protein
MGFFKKRLKGVEKGGEAPQRFKVSADDGQSIYIVAKNEEECEKNIPKHYRQSIGHQRVNIERVA